MSEIGQRLSMLQLPNPTHSGRGRSSPARTVSTTGSGSVAASSSATSATSASSRGREDAGQDAEESVVDEAGLRIGVPNRVVQSGGQLERQRRSRHAQITAANSIGVGNSSAARPPVRNFAAIGDRPPAPGDRVQRAVQAERERNLGVDSESRPTGGRPSSWSRPGCGSSPRFATATSTWRIQSAGQPRRAPRQARPAGIADEADRRGSRPLRAARSVPAQLSRHQERADHVRVPRRAVARCAATASRSGALPGGKTAASSIRPRKQRRHLC